MSLLIDALKRAEAQRPPGTEGRTSDEASRPAKEAVGPESAGPAAGRLPEIPRDLAILDDQFTAAGETDSRPTQRQRPSLSPEGVAASHEAAHLLFAAKNPGTAVRPAFALGVGIATVIAVITIGVYFWWQLQPKGGVGAVALSPAGRQPVPPSSPATVPAVPAVPPGKSQPEAPIPAPGPAASFTSAAAMTASPAPNREPPASAVAATPPGPAASSAGQSAVRLSRSTAENTLSPLLEAWQVYHRGEFERARVIWEKILQSDPRNGDALEGLATLAQHRGEVERASELYRSMLEQDPHDGRALAGLIALGQAGTLGLSPAKLKTLIQSQPERAELHFALGNLLAAEARWAEAQQAFFEAQRLQPENPDYAFNLAVSLDRLHQDRLAATWYRRAIEAAQRLPPGFALDAAQARLTALESQQP